MGQTLTEIAQALKDANKKVQLIYAFNGTGKTRLSREFKALIAPTDANAAEDEQEQNESIGKILYYNAFTEDLFYWDNDLEAVSDLDAIRKLKIHPNSFTDWVLAEQGQDANIIAHFQRYTNDKLTPRFNEHYNEISFSIDGGNDGSVENIKISKGEESCLIWCIFYSLLKQVVEVLNQPEPVERETNRFNDLEYVFIDDPVSSLDDNHLIELAVNIAELIKSSPLNLHYIITTHNPLFINVLINEIGNKICYMLDKQDDGTYELKEKKGDSNKSFSYHLYLKHIIEEAITTNSIQKYHFILLRNLYEKTANFLGYPQWSELLPDDKKVYYNRIIQFTSHSTLSNEVVPEPTEPEKQVVKFLLDHLVDNNYYKEEQNGTV